MTKEEVFYWALIGVRAERENAWKEYLKARRTGDGELADRMAKVYTQLDEKDIEIATMEVSDDEM